MRRFGPDQFSSSGEAGHSVPGRSTLVLDFFYTCLGGPYIAHDGYILRK